MKTIRLMLAAMLLMSVAAAKSPVSRAPTLWDDIDNIFSQMVDVGHQKFGELTRGMSSSMKVGENTDKDMYRIEVALPGYKKDDVSVEVSRSANGRPSTVTIKAVTKEEKKRDEKKERSWYFATREATSSMMLPAYVDPDSIEATMDNGVLLINFKMLKSAEEKKEVIKAEIK